MVEKTPKKTISEFRVEYSFLSNFYLTPVEYDGIIYPSAEHAYQAAKTLDMEKRQKIANLKKSGDAKHAGKKIEKRADWNDELKLKIMLDILRIKFKNEVMKTNLLETGRYQLVEGNWWNDTFWGVYKGEGKNHLGKLLMQVRDEIRKESK